MNRALFFVLGAVAIVCMAAVTAQAAAIPMAYDSSTSTVLMDWDMEGAGTPAVGSVTYNATGTASIGVVAGGGGEPAAYEGSQMLKSSRPDSGGNTSANLDFGSASGASSTITMDLAFRSEESTSGISITPGLTGSSGDVAGFLFWTSGIVYYTGPGGTNTDTGLTHNHGAWNELSLTHTNGTADWTISVNGSSTSVNFGSSGLANPLGAVGGVNIDNASYASTLYFDGIPVPEPSSLVLLAVGMMGLLAYAWRKRK